MFTHTTHTHVHTTSLVASAMPCQVQAGHPGIQVVAGLTLLYLAEECQFIAHDVGHCHLRSANASSLGPVLDWATEVSVSLDHKSGTVYPALCDSLTSTSDSSNDYWRRLRLRPQRNSDLLFLFLMSCVQIDLLTYLKTDTYNHTDTYAHKHRYKERTRQTRTTHVHWETTSRVECCQCQIHLIQ